MNRLGAAITGISGKIFLFILVCITLSAFVLNAAATASPETEEMKQCLLDASVSELLRLKRSLERMEALSNPEENAEASKNVSKTNSIEINPNEKIGGTDESCATQNTLQPMAMALTGQPQSRGYQNVDAVYHHHHPWQPEEKPSKLQTLFHISVTALSFLSFGGYLLCLIVQAIKSKGTTYFHPVTATASASTNNGVKRIKIYRRGRRATHKQSSLDIHYASPYPTITYGYPYIM